MHDVPIRQGGFGALRRSDWRGINVGRINAGGGLLPTACLAVHEERTLRQLRADHPKQRCGGRVRVLLIQKESYVGLRELKPALSQRGIQLDRHARFAGLQRRVGILKH